MMSSDKNHRQLTPPRPSDTAWAACIFRRMFGRDTMGALVPAALSAVQAQTGGYRRFPRPSLLSGEFRQSLVVLPVLAVCFPRSMVRFFIAACLTVDARVAGAPFSVLGTPVLCPCVSPRVPRRAPSARAYVSLNHEAVRTGGGVCLPYTPLSAPAQGARP